jgi:hypothetical protein
MISTPQEAKIAIEDWQHRLTTKGPLHPAPTIAQAQQAQHGTLIVSCAHCKRTEHVPLDAIRRPPDTSLADLLPGSDLQVVRAEGTPDRNHPRPRPRSHRNNSHPSEE